ncbi:MAG: TolB family protein, partial [Acidimicrobiia bacterium]
MSARRVSMPLLLVSLILVSPALVAQEKVLTPDLILGLKQIVGAQLSPDGARIAFQVARPRADDEKPGGAISEIWIVPTKGGEPYRFTQNDKSDRAPQWSPDGRTIAFLSQRGESAHTQIYLIRIDGGEASQLTKAENSVLSFKWSPDGSRIGYTV